MKNRIRIGTAVAVASAYLFVVATLAGMASESPGGAFLLLAYIAGSCAVAYSLYTRASVRLLGDANAFRRKFPLNPLGQLVAQFQHVFYCPEDLTRELHQSIGREIATRADLPVLSSFQVRDADRNLRQPDTREFWKTVGPENERNSAVALVLHYNRCGKMQGINWWVLVSGFVDRNKLFVFLAAAPLTLPFWIVPYLRHDYDLVSKLRTVYDSFYNDLDVLTAAKAVHETVFDTLVNVLDSHGIDISDLKAQRAQVMNITIRGGRTQIGQIIQGAISRMAPQAQPQQKAS